MLFFADRLPPLVGGMEMHAQYFIEHFANHSQFPIMSVITKLASGKDALLNEHVPVSLEQLSKMHDPAILFFNSGRWIEQLEKLRQLFPQATFIYRTGGNEILKASVEQQQIPLHSARKAYWAKVLNENIDYIITNSAYTEERLVSNGIRCSMLRCVGGVNCAPLKNKKSNSEAVIKLFSAARFVPYKNHSQLLSVFRELLKRGHPLQLELAGDGPLFHQIQTQAQGLDAKVLFLGALDNRVCCQKIVEADLYVQFSKDFVSEVEGGSYIHTEGMGRSILEAITAGTFIVAGNAGALSELITPERGLLLDLSNTEAIIQTLDRLLHNLPNRLPFTDEYCWNKIFKNYEDLFHEVA